MTYTTTPTVEAFSLSSITEIASNPPPRPQAGPEAGTQPLVLYIARVPGSRDVFLTPLKPREKIVSAEDVQSSLYYVHINTEVDAQILQPQSLSSVNTDAANIPTRQDSAVQRKPLPPPRSLRGKSPGAPSSPPYPLDNGPPQFQRRPPSPLKHQISRKPVLTDITNASSYHEPDLDLLEIPRRPLPPQPTGDSDRRNSLHEDNIHRLRHLEHNVESNPYVREYEPVEPALPVPEAGSLTLIRRDPASSAQWNVASIHDPPIHEVSSAAILNPTASRRVKKGGAPLYLDITNPGYLPFISASHSESRTNTSTGSSDTLPPPEGIFRRRLYMPGSKHVDHYSHKKSDSLNVPEAMPLSLRDRNSDDMAPYPDLTAPAMDRRSKLYSFLSPWDGRCEFTTSTSGKALRCRHTLPNNQGTIEVSELRFNLPTTAKPTPNPASTAEKRGSYFAGLHRRMRSEDSWGGGPSPEEPSGVSGSLMDDEDRLDLSLGQERAGGGFGGKQAKLGKLIVHPDGIAMLDLLVAANVGLWWRAWERV